MNRYGSEGPTFEEGELSLSLEASAFALEKPYGFDNACFSNWGAGSCWINSALQFVFSAEALRKKLWARGIAVLQQGDASNAQDLRELLHTVKQSGVLSLIRRCPQRRLDDDAISLTFCASLGVLCAKPRSGAAACPAFWFPGAALASDYRGLQDDAVMFLQQFQQTCPTMFQLLRGEFHCKRMVCTDCGEERVLEETSDQREFFVLEVHTCSEDTRQGFADVQAAIHQRLGMHMISTHRMETACSSCGSRENQGEIQDVGVFPEVLCLQIVSWENVKLSNGSWTVKRIPHDMHANGVITLGGMCYELCGMLLHQGRIVPGVVLRVRYIGWPRFAAAFVALFSCLSHFGNLLRLVDYPNFDRFLRLVVNPNMVVFPG